ncbi:MULTISPECIES: TadE/TadG family type IV pilus assembly protein [Paraburkholderia]|uniref:TadE/TadG family type IV pilus assembly protein n=1 Tax=Paraburkholderia TaxID=1822464 RepID=UPI00037FD5ED|nr:MULTISPECIES: TadE/TadG family type IV pilus assembly protein [Paraburkholderia]MDH6152931.1 Flp pilus assembly protein TadG [Paraburkholderia sp. WSM4179]
MRAIDIQRKYRRRHERGVAAVEFALVASMFFMLLIGIMEMGRVLFYWNTAAEATRLGARVAVVCDINSSQSASNPVIKDMQKLLPILQPSNVTVTYAPAGCDATSCTSVTVAITNVTVNTVVPFVPFNLTMPPFSTRLPRESLSSVGGTNPTCS